MPQQSKESTGTAKTRAARRRSGRSRRSEAKPSAQYRARLRSRPERIPSHKAVAPEGVMRGMRLAERVGFEPTRTLRALPVFETGSFGHSDTSPPASIAAEAPASNPGAGVCLPDLRAPGGSRAEEFLNHFAAFHTKNPTGDLGAVVQPRVVENAVERPRRAPLRVGRAEDDTGTRAWRAPRRTSRRARP